MNEVNVVESIAFAKARLTSFHLKNQLLVNKKHTDAAERQRKRRRLAGDVNWPKWR
jgi:hypothetical protein